MKTALKLTLQNFLINFTPYFLVMLGCNYFMAKNLNFDYVLFSSFVVSLLLTAYQLGRHILAVKKLHSGKLTDRDFRTRQTLDLQVPFSNERILAKLQRNYFSRDWEIVADQDAIQIATPGNNKTGGETIFIKIKPSTDSFHHVSIESKTYRIFSLGNFSLFDYGRNQENILFLRQLLTTGN